MMKAFYKQKGFTMLEFIISASILAAIVAISSNFIFQNFETSNYLKTQNIMKDSMQTALYRIEKSLAQSKRLYENDTNGRAFIEKLDLNDESKGLVVLPTIRATGTLVHTKKCDAYPENYFWPLAFGNSLFFAQLTQSFGDYGFDPSEGIVSRKINLYRFILYYVETNDEQPILDLWNTPATMHAQRLRQWESKLYADHTDFTNFMSYLSSADPGKRSDVVDVLENMGVAGLWDPKQANPNSAFYNLQASTTPGSKSGSYKIERFKTSSALLLPENDSTLYSIAYNKNTDKESSSFFPLKTEVPQFYSANPTPDASTCGANAIPNSPPDYDGPSNAFPGGFEIGIVGPNSGRSVFINLTAVGRFKGSRLVEQNHSISAFARDY